MSGHTSETIAPLIAPTLDAFVANAAPTCRKVAETIYEELLYSVQDYLRSNAEWNIGAELDRCRRTEAENRDLYERQSALLDALELADALLRGANMNRGFVKRKVSAAIALAKGTGHE